ncbi:hypothetical protein ADILRU_1158 [Leifsonia rubra CMS 76R]|nr:hypothetical protein ADILRU_1158 [Leifsonia rubra CMS 76R]
MTDAAALVRSLLLPLAETGYADAVGQLASQLDTWNVDEADRSMFVQDLIQRWRGANPAPANLRKLVSLALDSQPDLPAGFAKKYFVSLEKLQSRNNLLSFEQARGLLSNTLFIKNLLQRDGMSAAQVALILNASQNTIAFTWRHVQIIADALSVRPSLEGASVAVLHEQDLENEPLSFADANPAESIEILAQKAAELGYPGDMADQLKRFLNAAGNFESAFAVVLHVNALITQFFDHPLSQAAYEFEPRGTVISTTMKTAHPSYQAAESPYLNNAKGTFAFDTNWAWGRKERNRRQAHALVELLDGLGEMAYHPRRELASWVRQWLLRMERARSETFVLVDPSTKEGAKRAIARILAANTATQGVLEQRLLDLAVAIQYAHENGWLLRGIGDSVNASNVSKKKLGDLEAENPRSKKIDAFEPHGGKLTQLYVDRHRNSLAQVLQMRLDDLQAFGPASEWQVRVVFIAHDVSAMQDFYEEILGFGIQYEFVTYESYFLEFQWDDSALDKFATLLVDPISEPWIPDAIKLALNAAMAS